MGIRLTHTRDPTGPTRQEIDKILGPTTSELVQRISDDVRVFREPSDNQK